MITKRDLQIMRKIQDKTQIDMAKELGISVPTYKNWEREPGKMPAYAYKQLELMLFETKYEFKG